MDDLQICTDAQHNILGAFQRRFDAIKSWQLSTSKLGEIKTTLNVNDLNTITITGPDGAILGYIRETRFYARGETTHL